MDREEALRRLQDELLREYGVPTAGEAFARIGNKQPLDAYPHPTPAPRPPELPPRIPVPVAKPVDPLADVADVVVPPPAAPGAPPAAAPDPLADIAEPVGPAPQPAAAPPAPPESWIGEMANRVGRGWNNLQDSMSALGHETGFLTTDELAANLATNEQDRRRYPKSAAEIQSDKEFREAKGFWQTLTAILKNPENVVVGTMVESLPQSIPSIAGGVAGGIAAGPIGAGIGIGAGSAATESAASLLDFLREKGVDVASPDAVKKAFADEALMAEAKEYGLRRGIAVGLFDAITAGIGGKTMRAIRNRMGTSDSELVRRATEAGTQAAGAGIEGVGGASGEAAAQIASEGEVKDWKDVTLEGIAEVPGGLTESGIAAGSEALRAPANPVEAVVLDPGGPLDGQTVKVAPDQSGAKPNMVVVRDPSGRMWQVGKKLLRPNIPQPQQPPAPANPPAPAAPPAATNPAPVSPTAPAGTGTPATPPPAGAAPGPAPSPAPVPPATSPGPQPAAPPAPSSPPSTAPAPSIPPGERAVLREMGNTDADIDEMNPAERAAELELAREMGITVTPDQEKEAESYGGTTLQPGGAGVPSAAPVLDGDRAGPQRMDPGGGAAPNAPQPEAPPAPNIEPDAAPAPLVGDGSKARPAQPVTSDDLDPVRDRVVQPTDAQAEAGNYRKGHFRLHGMDLAMESPRGTMRTGTDPDGNRWETELPADYGYVKGTKGADGDPIDVYLGPDLESDRVFIIDQYDLDGRPDEHKLVMGVRTREEAEQIYDGGFSDGTGPQRRGNVVETDPAGFRAMLDGEGQLPAVAKTRPAAAPASDPLQDIAELYGVTGDQPPSQAPAADPFDDAFNAGFDAPQQAPAPAPAPAKKRRRGEVKPVRLWRFLAGIGGLKPAPELDMMDARRYPGLVSPNGRDLDYAREAAAEAGYLGADPEAMGRTDINDLLTALDADMRRLNGGVVPYFDRLRQDDIISDAERERRSDAEDVFDAVQQRIADYEKALGFKLNDDLRRDTAHGITNDVVAERVDIEDVDDAFIDDFAERTALQQDRDAMEMGELEPILPGDPLYDWFDAPDVDTTPAVEDIPFDGGPKDAVDQGTAPDDRRGLREEGDGGARPGEAREPREARAEPSRPGEDRGEAGEGRHRYGATPEELAGLKPEEILFCVACSNKKSTDAGDVPAWKRYAPGAWWQYLAPLFRNGRMTDWAPNMVILSGKEGWIRSGHPLEDYNERLSPERAAWLIENGPNAYRWDSKPGRMPYGRTFNQIFETADYKAVVLIGGGDYRRVFRAMIEKSDRLPDGLAVVETDGAIGQIRGTTKKIVETVFPSDSAVEPKAPAPAAKPQAQKAPENSPAPADTPFAGASKTVYVAKNEPFIPQAEANDIVARWKAEAQRIGRTQDNSNRVVLSFFDRTGVWSKPWKDAGYVVLQYDITAGNDMLANFPVADVDALKEAGAEVVGVLAAPPCTSFSSAGARWWGTQHDVPNRAMVAKKFGAWASDYFETPLEYSKTLVWATEAIVDQAKPSWFHAVENPVGRISEETGIGKPLLHWQPHNFADPYTKRTYLWGQFNTDLPTANVDPVEGSKIHKLRGDVLEQKLERSETPEGFAYAFFMANHRDGPALTSDADRWNPDHWQQQKDRDEAFERDKTIHAIEEAIRAEDFDGARQLLADPALDEDDREMLQAVLEETESGPTEPDAAPPAPAAPPAAKPMATEKVKLDDGKTGQQGLLFGAGGGLSTPPKKGGKGPQEDANFGLFAKPKPKDEAKQLDIEDAAPAPAAEPTLEELAERYDKARKAMKAANDPNAPGERSFEELKAALKESGEATDAYVAKLAEGKGGLVLVYDENKGALITPDTINPGAWRVTWFDKRGFGGHMETRDKAQAVELALQSGYRDTDRGFLNKMRRNPEWEKDATTAPAPAPTPEPTPAPAPATSSRTLQPQNAGGLPLVVRPGETTGEAAKRAVIEHGKRVNREATFIVTPDGETLVYAAGGLHRSVQFEMPDIKRMNGHPATILHHNHPVDVALSQNDLAVFYWMKTLKVIHAYSNASDLMWRAEITDAGREAMTRGRIDMVGVQRVFNKVLREKALQRFALARIKRDHPDLYDRAAQKDKAASKRVDEIYSFLVFDVTNRVFDRAGAYIYSTNQPSEFWEAFNKEAPSAVALMTKGVKDAFGIRAGLSAGLPTILGPGDYALADPGAPQAPADSAGARADPGDSGGSGSFDDAFAAGFDQPVAAPAAAPAPAKRARAARPRKPTAAKLVDRLENYFREHRVIPDRYMSNFDRVVDFTIHGEQSWSVTVIETDKDGQPRAGAQERRHRTQPDERTLKIWETDNPVGDYIPPFNAANFLARNGIRENTPADPKPITRDTIDRAYAASPDAGTVLQLREFFAEELATNQELAAYAEETGQRIGGEMMAKARREGMRLVKARAQRIIDYMQGGREIHVLGNPTRVFRDPSQVRVGPDGSLEVQRGQQWEAVPINLLDNIEKQLGIVPANTTGVGDYYGGHNPPELAPEPRQAKPKAAPKKKGDDPFGDIADLYGISAGTENAPSPTYGRAVPLFKKAAERFPDLHGNPTALVTAIVRELRGRFGDEIVRRMKEDMRMFHGELLAGTITLGTNDAPSPRTNLEPRGGGGAPDGVRPPLVPPPPPSPDDSADGGGDPADGGRGDAGGRGDVSPDGAPAMGGGRNRGGRRGSSDGPVGRGGGSSGGSRLPADRRRKGGSSEDARDGTRVTERQQQQAEADKIPLKPGDLENIDATLPLLLPPQREDVKKAEDRFEAGGYGMLFTNGTGTGKTYTGAGIIKRFVRSGQGRILVVAPSDGIMAAWQAALKDVLVDASLLPDTKSAGEGVVITTYANLGANEALAASRFDLVVADESHFLMSSAQAEPTSALRTFRAATGHPDGFSRFEETHPKTKGPLATMKAITARRTPLPGDAAAHALALEEYRKVRDQVAEEYRMRGRGRAVFLSATPFAYIENLDYAEGYLFDYPAEDARTVGAYGHATSRSRFYIENFGFRMRTGKLTQPEAGVRLDAMAIMFHERLKATGAMSGRRLEIEADYERRFVLIEEGIGGVIDRALKWLRETDDGRFWPLADRYAKRFDYLARMRFLEAIKARAAVDRIREHQELGRKVVVFHDFIEGGGFHPFVVDFPKEMEFHIRAPSETDRFATQAVNARELQAEFHRRLPEVLEFDFGNLHSPLTTLLRAFPDAMPYNGSVSKTQRRANLARFNDDSVEKAILIVQSDAGSTGISAHDTTGKHRRVLLNLGLPRRPTYAIQQEGRIRREGQHPESNALYEYFNTGTMWERMAFAQSIAQRADAVEKLALGPLARRLRDSFIESFENSTTLSPAPEDGTGGIAQDRQLDGELTPYDRARSLYYARMKNARKRQNREGVDYYATPEPLGLKMVEMLDLKPSEKFLEPSAGHGAISRWAPETTDRTIIEPSLELASQAGLSTPGARLLTHPFENLNPVNKYHGIAMNPPFGRGGKTAVEHIAKAFNHLKRGGRIVALVPDGQGFTRFIEWYMGAQGNGARLRGTVTLPDVTFERAGTRAKTVLVILDRAEADTPDLNGSGGRTHPDLSYIDNVEQLFDRVQELDAPPRLELEPEPEDIEERDYSMGGVTFEVTVEDDATYLKPKGRLGGLFKDVIARAEKVGGLWAKSRGALKIPPGIETFERLRKDLDDNPPKDLDDQPKAEEAAKQTFATHDAKHTKTGKKLFLALPEQRVSREAYLAILEKAKGYGGYWSPKFKDIPAGFSFASAEDRESFIADVGKGASIEAQTESVAFREWFGASKFVDKAGRPLRLYHGTANDFDEFSNAPWVDTRHIPLPGFYFTPDPEKASDFAFSASRAKTAKEKNFGASPYDYGMVMPVYVSVKNPAYIDVSRDGTPYLASGSEVEARLIEAIRAGHDGAVITGWADGSGKIQYVAFRPEQIKSAIGNSGAFDPSDPSVLAQRAPEGWDVVDLDPGIRMSPADEREVLDIVRRVTGLDAAVVANLDAPPEAFARWGDTPGTHARAAGKYTPATRLIEVAVSSPDPRRTAWHEAFHDVQFRLMNEQERAVLNAETDRLRAFLAAAPHIGERAARMSRLEVEAEAFAVYQRQRMDGAPAGAGVHIIVRRAWERIIRVLAEIRAWAEGRGFQSFEDVFERAGRGEMAGRTPRTTFVDGFDPMVQAQLIPAPVGRSAASAYARLRNHLAYLTGDWLDGVRIAMQDRFLPIRRAEEWAAEQGIRMIEGIKTYAAEGRFYGRAGARGADLNKKYMEPLIELLQKHGIKLTELDTYLIARHAKERNDFIEQVRSGGTIVDGSGMTTQEAAKHLAAVAADPRRQGFIEAARIVDEVNRITLDRLEAYGLISHDAADELRKRWKFYVPLRGWELDPEATEENGFPHIGKGYNVRGREYRNAHGRGSRAYSPTTFSFLQAQQAIIRGEKNVVLRTFLRFVKTVNDPDFAEVVKGEYRKRINASTGLTETYFVAAQNMRDQDVVALKIDGKGIYIRISDRRVLRAMKQMGASETNGFVRFMMAAARMFSAMQTQWNPNFWFTNMPRDFGTAMFNISDTEGLPPKVRRQMATKLPKAWWSILRSVRNGRPSGPLGAYWDEYRLAGGQISFLDIGDLHRIRGKLTELENPAMWRRAWKGSGIPYLAEWVSDINTAIENQIRLTTYIALREGGFPQSRAATIARELTVNFNRRGNMSPVLNSLWVFFNASTQGIVRMLHAMIRSKKVQAAMVGIVGMGAANDMMNQLFAEMWGDDDDEKRAWRDAKAWDKERNIMILIPHTKNFIKIPMPYGYSWFWNIGRIGSALARGEPELTTGKALTQIASTFLDSFNPLGSSATVTQWIAPTFADPFIQIVENTNWNGIPVMPTKYDQSKPDSQLAFDSVSPWWKSAAEGLNELTGGNIGRPGAIDVSPETLEHMAGFLSGGLGRFISGVVSTGTRVFEGGEILPERIPIVQVGYTSAGTVQAMRDLFYERYDAIRQAKYELKQFEKANEPLEVRRIKREFKADLSVAKQFEELADELSTLRKRKTDIRKREGLSMGQRDEKIRRIEERELRLIKRAIEAHDRAMRRAEQ